MSDKREVIKPKNTCQVPGCGKHVLARNYCKQHYERFIARPNHRNKEAVKREEKKKQAEQDKKTKAKPKKDNAPTYTPEQLEKIFLSPCPTEKDLRNFIKYFFGIYLPDCRVSRFADTDPFHALWEMYRITVLDYNPEDITEIIYVASRGSGKTLAVSIAQLMAVIHGQRDVVHVGAIHNQAKRAYEYIQKYLLGDRVKAVIAPPKTPDSERILQKSTMERTALKIDGIECAIEILPCTLKAVNGPHVSLVTVDEVDTISGEGLKAYKDISGMLDSKRGKRPLRVNISTRKSRYGLMEAQIASAEKMGKTVRRWTALEFMKRCPDDRSGINTQEYYVSVDEGSAFLKEDWDKMSESKQKEYEKVEAYDKCLKCPLLPWCRGDAKKQISKSPMLKSVQEIAAKVLSEGPDWTSAQLFNLKPSVEGVVFKEFDERVHVKNWNQMWKTLTGKDFPGQCDHNTFVMKCQQMRLACYAGVDFGWVNPSTIVVAYIDSSDNIYVVKTDGITYRSHPEWLHYISQKYHPVYRPQLYMIDVADPGDLVEAKKAGLPAHSNVDKGNISTGVQVIKKFLRAPQTLQPKIFLAEETTKPLIKEFTLYHFKTLSDGTISDEYDKDWDHWLDALRYILQTLYGKTQAVMDAFSLDADMSKVMDASGNLFKVPTGEEYMKILGLRPGEEVSKEKLGKIGRLSELESEVEEDVGVGGFIWSM